MPVTQDQVDIWRAAPTETQTLEFKEAKNQYDSDKLFGYCVAIANEGGGHLILGVKNRPPREVVGTSAFPSCIVIAERIFQAVGFRVDVDEVKHPAGRVLVFSVAPERNCIPLARKIFDALRRILGSDERRSASEDFCRGQARLARRTLQGRHRD